MFFALAKAALLEVVLHVIVLQPAFAGLVADRTIHRVIDQQKLHHRFARREHLRALGQDRHAFRRLSVAGDLQLGHFFDFDEAHAAIAGDRQLGMVAIVRNRDTGFGRRLNHRLALGGDDGFAVDSHFDRVHIVQITAAWSGGVLECWSIASFNPSLHHRLHHSTTPSVQYSILSERTAPVGDMRFELLSVFPNERACRHGRGVAKRADRITHDVAADVKNQIQVAGLAVAMLETVKNLFHPVTAFAARAALAAGFMGEEA